MKKVIAILCLLALLTQGYAQRKRAAVSVKSTSNCVTVLPYKPVFGVIGDTAAERWSWDFDGANGSGAAARWRFQSVDGVLVPFFNNGQATYRSNTLFSRCISFDETKKYELRFTFNGNTVGATHNLILSLVDSIRPNVELEIASLRAIPFGPTSHAVMIGSFPASSSRDFRIAFKGDSVFNSSFYLKDITLSEIPNHQLDIVALSSPLSKCDLSNQTVSFKIRNSGFAVPQTYQICYQYNTGEGTPFGNPICESFTGIDIPYNEIREVKFTTPRTFNSAVTIFNAWVSHTGQTVFDTLKNVALRRTTSRNVPYSFSFDDNQLYRDWVVIPKITQPDITWDVPLDDNGLMGGKAVIVTSGLASDDRLMTGCIQLEKDTLYKISFTYNANSTSLENLLFYVGTNNIPHVSDIPLMDIRGFNNTDSRTISAYFRPDSSGNYFFGFWAYSAASSGGISISEFAITTATPTPVPVFNGFESYDIRDGWQTFSYNAAANGWRETNVQSEVFNFFSPNNNPGVNSNTALKTLSTTAPNSNNNWLISKPLALEEGKTYEIKYFRKTATSSATEILNIRVSDHIELQTLSLSTPLFRDTVTYFVTNTNWDINQARRRVYFTPSKTGTYYVTFQYNSATNRSGTGLGLCLDDIAIRDSLTAADTNLSVVGLAIPAPSCALRNNEALTLSVKNRSGYSIPTGRVTAQFNINGNPIAQNIPSSIPAYQTINVTRNNVNMSSPGTPFEIQAWISGDQNPLDDTSVVKRTQNIQPISGEYTMGFEPTEDRTFWTNSQTGTNRIYWWQFVENPAWARTGVGLAHLEPLEAYGDSIRQSIGTPCLRLSSDTTYFISFFYRAVRTSNAPTRVNVYAGPNNSTTTAQLRGSFSATNLDYQRAFVHYRPRLGDVPIQYVLLEGVSRAYSGGLRIDDFLILDSVTASLPNLAINRLWTISSNKCDLSPDTIYVEIANNGFFPYSNPAFTIRFGNQNFSETWNGTIPVDASVVVKLQTLFRPLAYGEDSVRVTLNIPNNRTKTHLSEVVKSAKYPPVQPPHSITFLDSEILPWNNLPETFNLENFEYWQFKGSAPETYAFFQNGTLREKHGLLASGCISLIANEPYLITYRYRAESVMYTENLQVQRERINGTVETLFNHPAITNTSYTSNSVSFVASGTGNERIRFHSNYNAYAQGIYINYFEIKVDTSRWPITVNLIAMTSPVSGTNLSAQEPVTVFVSSVGRRPLRNLPIHYTMGGVRVTDTIPSLDPGQTLMFTFKTPVNLSQEGLYRIVVFTEDPTITNGSIEQYITHERDTGASILIPHPESNLLSIYPNPASTEVFIKSSKEISTLFIYDVRGFLLSEIRINGTEYHLSTSDFPTGVYVFSFQIGDGRVSRRVVIQNNQP